MDIFIPLLIIAVLILLNGLFVAAEFAIIGAPRAAIERRAAEGNQMARIVRDILHDPRRQDRYIATAQLGITFASLGLGMYGEHVLAGWLAPGFEFLGAGRWIAAHTIASIVSIAILTYLHIVVGEMVPKSFALSHAEATALWVTRPMLWIKTALYPLVIGLNGIGNAILRLFGVERELTRGHFHTPEELEMIVDESQKGGLLRAEAGRVLRELFDFADLLAREVMVPRVRVTALRLGTTPEELHTILQTTPRTRYPVYDRDLDDIAGVIHIKHLLRLLAEGRPLAPSDLGAPAFVPETAPLDTVAEAMSAAHTQLAIVMDEHGGTAGIVTLADLCAEVVGETRGGGAEDPAPKRESDGRLRVPGTLRLDELGEALGITLEHEEVDTVSGLVLALLGRPAAVGDTVTYSGVLLEVTAVRGRGVRECLARRLDRPDAAQD